MPETKQWIVTANGDVPLADVQKALTDAGFAVNKTMTEIGCFVGTASDADAEAVKRLPGVAAVEPDTVVSVGPPGADPTW